MAKSVKRRGRRNKHNITNRVIFCQRGGYTYEKKQSMPRTSNTSSTATYDDTNDEYSMRQRSRQKNKGKSRNKSRNKGRK